MEEDLLPFEKTKEGGSSRKTLRWIFKGSGGIRAGWSLLLFLAALIGACYPMVKIDSALSLMVVSVLFGVWLWRHRVSRATLGGTPRGTSITIPEQDSIP